MWLVENSKIIIKKLVKVLVFFGKWIYTKVSGREPTQTSKKLHKNKNKVAKIQEL